MNYITLRKNLGENIRRLRVVARLSQVKLANEANLHVSFINGIEQGNKNMSLLSVHKIASVLNVPIPELLENAIRNKRFKAVIFDLHYTLTRLNPSRGLVYRDVLKRYGLQCQPRKIKRAFNDVWDSYGNKRISAEHSRHHNEKKIEKWWLDFHHRMLTKLGCNDKNKSILINTHISNQFYTNPKMHRVYADAKKILRILKMRKTKLALVTNGYKSTKKIIDGLGLKKYFNCIIISSAVGLSKPNPQIFRLVSKTFSLKPEEILCVGDNYPTDIIGAKRAGCGAAIIDRKNRNYKKVYDCIYLNNLLQVKSLVEE